MMENFEGGVKKDLHREDLRALTSQIREQESLVRLKRRWLMDLPLSIREQKKIDEILPPNDKILPESFLREDDVSYEDVRNCIETAFGVRNCGKEPHSIHKEVCGTDSRDGLQEIFFLLDAMTNKGLYSIAKILTEGEIKFDKTNWSMKRRIKELLPEVIAIKNDISKTKMKQLFQLLQDPNSFHGNQMALTTASAAYSSAAIKVLDGLEDFPSKALSAMHRKLRCVRGYIPSMKPSKSGMLRDNVIRVVKKRCMEMLSKLSEVDEPSEQLAGALGVAGLTLKLMMDRPAIRAFRRFSPEIEALQNDIVKAIHLLNEENTVSLIELKKVQNLLDPNFELSMKSLRTAIRNLLIDYLYECGDMDKIPDCIVKTLDIINRRSQLRPRKRRSTFEAYSSPQKLMKELMEKEVECVLTISAQAKEVISNLLLIHDFDEEFAHAYMEDYEVTDSLGFSDDDEQVRDISQHLEFHSYNLHVEESIGEATLEDSNSPVSTSKRDGYSLLSPIGRPHATQNNSDKTNGFPYSLSFNKLKVLDNRCSGELGIAYSDSVKLTTKQKLSYQSHSPARSSCRNDLKIEETTSGSAVAPKYVEETDVYSQQSRSPNQYLEVQEACDATSMITYRFVGVMLDKLSKSKGLVLYHGDRSYLHNYASIPEDFEEHHDALLASKFTEMWNNVLQQ